MSVWFSCALKLWVFLTIILSYAYNLDQNKAQSWSNFFFSPFGSHNFLPLSFSTRINQLQTIILTLAPDPPAHAAASLVVVPGCQFGFFCNGLDIYAILYQIFIPKPRNVILPQAIVGFCRDALGIHNASRPPSVVCVCVVSSDDHLRDRVCASECEIEWIFERVLMKLQ